MVSNNKAPLSYSLWNNTDTKSLHKPVNNVSKGTQIQSFSLLSFSNQRLKLQKLSLSIVKNSVYAFLYSCTQYEG